MDGPAVCPTDSSVTAQRSWPTRVHRRRDEHWRYERFLTTVGEQTGLDRDDSERGEGDARDAGDMRRGCPLGLDAVEVRAAPHAVQSREFVDPVAQKEGISFDAAFEHTRAAFATLAEGLPPGQLRDILDELPRVSRDTLYQDGTNG